MEDNVQLPTGVVFDASPDPQGNEYVDERLWGQIPKGTTIADHFKSKPIVIESALSFAAKDISRWSQQILGKEIEADQVLLVTLNIEFGSSVPHRANVVHSMTLAEALLRNWQQEGNGDWFDHLGRLRPYRHGGYESIIVAETLHSWDCNAYEALYRKTSPQRYDATTHLDISPVQFKKYIWDANFQSRYVSYLDEFWADHAAGYPHMLKAALFQAACLQEKEKSLGHEEKAMVCEAIGIPTYERWETMSYREFDQAQASGFTTLCELSVYGYTAADIMVIRSSRRRTVLLYVPGNSSPIHAFENEQAMQDWVAQICRDPKKRRAFESHFNAVDDGDGAFYSGLNTALKGFAVFPKNLNASTGQWNARYLVTIGEPQTWYPFVHFANNLRAKTQSDARQKIRTRTDYWKEEVSSGLSECISVLGGVVMIFPELMPVIAGMSALLVGLGVDEAIEGRTLEEKNQGLDRIAFGVLNGAPYLAEALSPLEPGLLPQREGVGEAGTVIEPPQTPVDLPTPPTSLPALRPEPAGLRSLNARMRRLLGKLESSEQLPEEMRRRANGVYYRQSKGYIEVHEKTYRVEWVSAQEQYRIRTDGDPKNWGPFVKVDDTGYWDLDLKTGLRGGQSFDGSALSSLDVMAEVILPEWEKVPQQAWEPPVLVELPLDNVELEIVEGIAGRHAKERYFIKLAGKRSRVYYDADVACWRKTAADTDLVWLNIKGEWEQGSLKVYKKIEHKLAASASSEVYRFPRLPSLPKDAKPIPRNIHHIWMGERLPGEELIANIKKNMDTSPDMMFTFHVDIEQHGAADQLAGYFSDYPNMRIVRLEDEPFYGQEVVNGENAAEFNYFRHGKNRNYAAASDILRYHLLYEYGGIYMDCDDAILASFKHASLNAGPNDVLMGELINAPQLSYVGPNNSHFASHAKNPVLKNMTREIRARFFREDREFLAAPRPYIENTNEKIGALSRARMGLYMTRISRLTGPRLFSDVVSGCRPDYFSLLERSLLPVDEVLSVAYIDRLNEAADFYFPFKRRARISPGSANEWAKASVVSEPIVAEPEPFEPKATVPARPEPLPAESLPHARTQPDSPSIEVRVPFDGVEVVNGRYYIELNARRKAVVYDADIEAWTLANNDQAVVTRDRDGDWQAGQGVGQASSPGAVDFQIITLPRLPEIEQYTLPIPRKIHYLWLGGNQLPDELVSNIIKNAKNSPDFKSILHVDVDSEQTLDAIRKSVKGKAASLSVSNLKDEAFFKEFLRGENAEIFHKARNGVGKNYAAASDVVRYPLMDYYGGMYMDADESFAGSIKGLVFEAAQDDVLLGKEVAVPSLEFLGYNNSCFASQPSNRVLAHLSRELRRRYLKSPDFFDTAVPVVDHSTPVTELISKQALGPYKKKVFELTGPSLFNDVLREQRPDYYAIGAGKREDDVVRSKQYRTRFNEVLNHYFPFRDKAPVLVGNAHNW
jgi:mannosyltransferase OCH1-like enzyme